MPFREATGYCHGCTRQVLVRQETTNNVLYAILTLFSCGLWAIVWIISSMSSRPWLCTICGRPDVEGQQRRAIIPAGYNSNNKTNTIKGSANRNSNRTFFMTPNIRRNQVGETLRIVTMTIETRRRTDRWSADNAFLNLVV